MAASQIALAWFSPHFSRAWAMDCNMGIVGRWLVSDGRSTPARARNVAADAALVTSRRVAVPANRWPWLALVVGRRGRAWLPHANEASAVAFAGRREGHDVLAGERRSLGWRTVSGMHFERMAEEYAEARPAYPDAVFDALEAVGAIGHGLRVLEVGAGAGLATAELSRRGCDVVALEPGGQLASLLMRRVAGAEVLVARLEDVQLPDHSFDSAVAATSMHWVDLSIGLPKLHKALRPRGWLAVWRTIFGDDDVQTEFRARVSQIVARRARGEEAPGREQRPTVDELTAGGWFEPVRTEHWRWSVDLNAHQVGRLFASFSNWTAAEAQAAAQAAEDLGGLVTEHYQSVLHLLRSTAQAPV
jgi:SAM-dependent methyltransferase